MKFLPVIVLLLSACVSRETTLVTQQRDTDQKLYQLESLRLQRDMLETERLKLWATPSSSSSTSYIRRRTR